MEFTQHQNVNDVVAIDEKLKCSNSARIETEGNKNDDPPKGKTCHQCRQKKLHFAVTCKNLKKGKSCMMRFCKSCLLTRYGENEEEVKHLADWICPKCREVCNCSVCQKRRGEQPTGRLYQIAKESGYKSVLEMLSSKKASEAIESKNANDVPILPSNEDTVEKEPEVLLSGNANDVAKVCNENEDDGSENVNDKIQEGRAKFPNEPEVLLSGNANDVAKICNENEDDGSENVNDKIQEGRAKIPNVSINKVREKIEKEIPFPQSTELTEILGIEITSEDVGKALQLLEFCRVFGKALDLKEKEVEPMLAELIRKQNLRGRQNTLGFQFLVKVLTLILNDSGNESPSLIASNGLQLKPLKDLITRSNHLLKDFPVDWLDEGTKGYFNLNSSHKLQLLNFLCDEALGTEKLRSYIQDKNASHAEEIEETKSMVVVVKEKEKGLKQKLQSEMAKVAFPNVTPPPNEDHIALILQLKSEVAQANVEMLKLKDTIAKGKHSFDATRIEPEFVDNNGQTFWKLKCYNGENIILLQDIKIQDETGIALGEKWFVYGPEKKDEVDKYISSRKLKRKRENKKKNLMEDVEPHNSTEEIGVLT